jgi:hypothetical protein
LEGMGERSRGMGKCRAIETGGESSVGFLLSRIIAYHSKYFVNI